MKYTTGYELRLEKHRKDLQKKQSCPNYVIQPYSNKDQYYGCSYDGIIAGLSFYPNCNMQCQGN